VLVNVPDGGASFRTLTFYACLRAYIQVAINNFDNAHKHLIGANDYPVGRLPVDLVAILRPVPINTQIAAHQQLAIQMELLCIVLVFYKLPGEAPDILLVDEIEAFVDGGIDSCVAS
jgi:hypothetical protein